MVAAPVDTPVTPPVPFTETVLLRELQVPPGVASDNEIDAPLQTDAGPVIAAGAGLTVTIRLTLQPAGATHV